MQEMHGEDDGGGGGESILETSQNIFKKYEVGKLMGCGAFAKVYHARDLRTGQSVAIKAISKQRIENGNLNPAHVMREIAIMHRLRHPNIVRLHEVLATKNKIYYVMEFAKGGELFGKMAKGRFSEDLSRRYFQQLISAVRYCHSMGIYHRDLKPENLLLDENWNLKVTDFGLSAVKEQTRPDGLLHTLCGTPAYVAPEILAKKGYDGAKVDIWSCGVILFVLNAGYLPFNDTNLMAMYKKIYKGEFRCPKWTSPELKRFFSRILDRNPVTRITIDEIMDDPWVKKGGFDDPKVSQLEWECELLFKDDRKDGVLNAFDIISLSPGLDLSGMFRVGGGGEVNVDVEKFVSSMSPEMILERFEEVAKEKKLKAIKMNNNINRLRLEGGGGHNGNFMWVVDVLRLTPEFVVVEIKRRDSCGSLDLWKNEFRPRLNDLVYDQLD